MKILHVGIFRDHCLGGDIVFRSAFMKMAFDYQEYDYRLLASQLGVAGMNRDLVDRAKGCDLVFIGKGELIEPSTLGAIQGAGSVVVIWYGDLRPQPQDWLVGNLKHCDVFFMTSAGNVLKSYFDTCRPARAAFFLNPANPDLVPQFSEVPRSVDPPLFTGTIHAFVGDERRMVLEYLRRRGDIQIVGAPRRVFRSRLLQRIYLKVKPVEYLRGRAYVQRIVRSKFGVGVSASQSVRYYTSDRMTHYLAFGKLYLAYRFPGCEDLFEDGTHFVTYDGLDDLMDKLEFYLANQELCEEIGRKGQQKMLSDYNAVNMVGMMLEIVSTGHSSRFPWIEVYS